MSYVSSKERNHPQKCNLFSKSGGFISWTACNLNGRKFNSRAVLQADEYDNLSCTASFRLLFIGLLCKVVSTSATFVFTMDALPDRFLSATDPVWQNRYVLSLMHLMLFHLDISSEMHLSHSNEIL
ncbi:hypothetical protein TNCT_647991 [Trichonephila clavata]|uniref:Uncharacterized protein n=1 Tax=Trichonephila clavata TaxID=2740835 RepID=A0A8X6LIQ6_TRICU|nr:hypothetical protein TNCT_647991 [Trichonephila clavata]